MVQSLYSNFTELIWVTFPTGLKGRQNFQVKSIHQENTFFPLSTNQIRTRNSIQGHEGSSNEGKDREVNKQQKKMSIFVTSTASGCSRPFQRL